MTLSSERFLLVLCAGWLFRSLTVLATSPKVSRLAHNVLVFLKTEADSRYKLSRGIVALKEDLLESFVSSSKSKHRLSMRVFEKLMLSEVVRKFESSSPVFSTADSSLRNDVWVASGIAPNCCIAGSYTIVEQRKKSNNNG